MDKHGNEWATEGVTRCACGCKYWENDTCVDCGAVAPKPVYDCQLEFGEHTHANEAEEQECQWVIENMSGGYPDDRNTHDIEYQNYMYGSSRF